MIGLTFDLVSRKEEKRNRLYAHPWDEKQVDFYARRLDEGIDYKCKETLDGRWNVYLYNPALIEFFENPLPDVDRGTKDDILNGLLSNATLRTLNRRGHKVILVTKSKPVFENVREISHMKKLDISTMEYPVIKYGKIWDTYSVWFLDPEEIKEYLLDEFELSVEDLPRWTKENYWPVHMEKTALERYSIYKRMKFEGRMNETTYSVKMKEFEKVKEELEKVEAEIAALKRSSMTLDSFVDTKRREEELKEKDLLEIMRDDLRERFNELREKLFDKPAPKKKHGDYYAKKRWNELKTRLDAGEIA